MKRDESQLQSKDRPRIPEPRAVAVARAHVEAFTNRDFATAKSLLAKDVQFNVLTTTPNMKGLSGEYEQFVEGIKAFGEAIVPGSVRIIDELGDDTRALLVFSYLAPWGPGGSKIRLVRSAHYFLNEEGKIKIEQVVFFPLADSP